MSTVELFLVAMLLVFAAPFLVWRLLRTEQFAPLVVVQIVGGVALGPGALGALFPESYASVFRPEVVAALNGLAWWAVMLFVWLAGVELDLRAAWQDRRASGLTAALALGVPLAAGAAAGVGMLHWPGWIGEHGRSWQFVLGIGMACAVTALPILILFLEKLGMLRQPMGQRVLRYASLDDLAIWGVLALILLDVTRLTRQLFFLLGFAPFALFYRRWFPKLQAEDRPYVSLISLAALGFAGDWAGLHFMVGAFLAGVIHDAEWFGQERLEEMRRVVLLVMMPVFFLSTGLRTQWQMGGASVLVAALVLLIASVAGKLLGTAIAGRILGWARGEAFLIGMLLQTKALIMIIFANVLLDRHIITASTFTALLLMAVLSTMLTIPTARRQQRQSG